VRAALGSPAPVPDGRLAALAEAMARHAQDREAAPGPEQLDAWTRRLGLVGPAPFVAVVSEDGGTWGRLDDFLRSIPKNVPITHYGVATFDWHGATLGAVALASVYVTVRSFPRTLDPGDTLEISGRLADGFSRAELAWTRPGGGTVRQPIASSPDLDLELPRLARGTHRVEVLATGPMGLTVVINVPIHVGVAEPADGAPADEGPSTEGARAGRGAPRPREPRAREGRRAPARDASGPRRRGAGPQRRHGRARLLRPRVSHDG
jgi:hypothetical protein